MTTNHDMTKLKRENDALRGELLKLRQLAYRDALTGLRNRRYFMERLDEEIDRGRRDNHGEFSLMIIDLDKFKEINDTHGHAAGDEALRFIAEFLEDNLRDHDICCRTGGDEFAVLLPFAGSEGADLTATRLQTALVVANKGRKIPVALSIGFATWPLDGESGERLMERADKDMYRDKARRREGATAPIATVKPRPRRDRHATIPWTPEMLR